MEALFGGGRGAEGHGANIGEMLANTWDVESDWVDDGENTAICHKSWRKGIVVGVGVVAIYNVTATNFAEFFAADDSEF